MSDTITCLAINCTLKPEGESSTQLLLEQLSEELATDDEGRMLLAGTVGGVVIVGNEDGAHNVTAQLYQGLADIGLTIPSSAATYWVGEAMGSTDYKDLDEVPEKVASTTAMAATNLAHVARLLRDHPYPPPGG